MGEGQTSNGERTWQFVGESDAYSRDALDLMVMDGSIHLHDEVEPVGGGQAVTVGDVLGILPALPVRERLDALAEGLELPDGQTIDTLKSDELPRVVSMIPRVDTMPVSKPKASSRLTPQRLGVLGVFVLGLGVIGFLLLPRADHPQGNDQDGSEQQSSRVNSASDKVVPIQRPEGQLLRPGQKRLSLEEKQAVLNDELEDLESCLPDHHRSALQIQFKIKPNGAPFAIRLNSEDVTLKDCVRTKVFRWRFPRFNGPSDSLAFDLKGRQ